MSGERDRAQHAPPSGGAMKFDGGKPRFDLLYGKFLIGMAQLSANGAVKYAPRNWEKGLAYGKVFSACCRHLFAFFFLRQRIDPETGQHHLVAVGWNAMALMFMDVEKPEWDDRDWQDKQDAPSNDDKFRACQLRERRDAGDESR